MENSGAMPSKFLCKNFITNKTINLLGGYIKAFSDMQRYKQKPYLLRINTYLRTLSENVLPQNVEGNWGGKKERKHDIPEARNQNQESNTGIHKTMATAMMEA